MEIIKIDKVKAFEEYKKINFENMNIIKKLREENRELKSKIKDDGDTIELLRSEIFTLNDLLEFKNIKIESLEEKLKVSEK